MDHKGCVLTTKDNVEIIDCEICGFAHCYPFPSEEGLADMYKEEYYTELKKDYLVDAERDKDWYSRVYGSYLEVMEKYTAGRSLLEIGSGPGLFLNEAHRRGWSVLGYEPSSVAWDYSTKATGLPIKNSLFSEETAQDIGSFDGIFMGWVLEHVPHPQQLLLLAYDKLNKNSVLCVSVPNDFSVVHRYLQDEKNFPAWWVSVPQHINYFSHVSLQRLLKRCGYNIEKVTSSFPIDFALLAGTDYISEPKLGRGCHMARVAFENSLREMNLQEFQDELYELFGRYGIGRDVIIFASKS